jgi:hypothetical protein
MADKIYVGRSKEQDSKYGIFHKISFSADDLKTLQSNLNKKGYVNLNMNKRKEASKYGDTHCITIDTWQPEKAKEEAKEVESQDLPF